MLGLVALPTPPQDAKTDPNSARKPLPNYALPSVSGQPPPPGIFYRPSADPQPYDASGSSPNSSIDSLESLPVSPPLDPTERKVDFEGVGSKDLPIEDREKMWTLMALSTSAADCEMAVDVINELIPPGPGSRVLSPTEQESNDGLLRRYINYWTALCPHPLCTLIGMILLLERLKRNHPSLSATGEIKDTTLRVVFSAYLLAMKLISDVSYTNSAFLRRCPWTQSEINSMEREMLHHLDYDAFIASGELLIRAKSFWTRREVEQARLQGDDGIPDLALGGVFGENLFLTSAKVPTATTPATFHPA